MRAYERVVARYTTLIESGELKPGARLPFASQIAADMGVSASTVDQAMRSLRERGLVVGRSGAGRFVAGGDNEETNPGDAHPDQG